MPAYLRGELSLEAYLVRLLAALCRANGGELRIKGELVDVITEPTTLLKDWDSATQEVVIRTHMGNFGEVFRVVPEKIPPKEVFAAAAAATSVDPLKRQEPEQSSSLPSSPSHPKSSSSLDDAKLIELENKLRKQRIASMLRDELDRRRQGS